MVMDNANRGARLGERVILNLKATTGRTFESRREKRKWRNDKERRSGIGLAAWGKTQEWDLMIHGPLPKIGNEARWPAKSLLCLAQGDGESIAV